MGHLGAGNDCYEVGFNEWGTGMTAVKEDLNAKYVGQADHKVKSFTAASGLPWKLLQNKGCVVDGKIRPVHLQLFPTNRCDWNKCAWCSCHGVDRTKELSLGEIRDIFAYFARLGTSCVTITGGGEPTAHRHLREIMEDALRHDIEIGMVTNGMKWSRPDIDIGWANIMLTWLRISTVDPHAEPDTDRFKRICERLPDVDIGISFTVPNNVNIAYAKALCEIADSITNLTHIRFVDNIMSPDSLAMAAVKQACDGITSKAIFQERAKWVRGAPACLISKLKPVIDATGKVYACCGAQYSIKEYEGFMPQAMCMGHWSDFSTMLPFDGKVCDKCYYDLYNIALKHMTERLDHERFV